MVDQYSKVDEGGRYKPIFNKYCLCVATLSGHHYVDENRQCVGCGMYLKEIMGATKWQILSGGRFTKSS